MFVSVVKSKLPRGLAYLWIPHMLVKPPCRKDSVLLDCYFSSTLGKEVLMVLLSRAVRKGLSLESSAPLDYPVLFSSNCNILYYQEALRRISESLREDRVESLVLRPQDARSRSLVVQVFQYILKRLCFPDPPQDLSQVYVLVGIDISRRRACLVLGNSVIRSAVLEEVIYGDVGGLKAISPYLREKLSPSPGEGLSPLLRTRRGKEQAP